MGFQKGHVKACKVCNHEMRDEIEIQKIVYKMSFNKLRDLVAARDPEGVMSTESMRRHFERHVDEKREIQVRYMEEKRLNEDTSKYDLSPEMNVRLIELRNLDKTINESTELAMAARLELKRQLSIRVPKFTKIKDRNGEDTGEVFLYDKVEVSHSVVQLFKASAEEVRQASKAKREILGMDSKVKAADAVTTLADMLISTEEDL